MDFRPVRKKIIVKPGYQLRLALTLSAYIIIYSIILGFIIFYPLYSEINSPYIDLEEQARVSAFVLYLHKRIWAGLFAVAVLAGIHTLFSSHRAAGPMYRFEDMVRELTGGNYSKRIRIRKKDEFKELEVLLNELAATLGLEKVRGTQFYTDVKTRLETITAMLEAEGAAYPEDVRRLMQQLVAELTHREKFTGYA